MEGKGEAGGADTFDQSRFVDQFTWLCTQIQHDLDATRREREQKKAFQIRDDVGDYELVLQFSRLHSFEPNDYSVDRLIEALRHKAGAHAIPLELRRQFDAYLQHIYTQHRTTITEKKHERGDTYWNDFCANLRLPQCANNMFYQSTGRDMIYNTQFPMLIPSARMGATSALDVEQKRKRMREMGASMSSGYSPSSSSSDPASFFSEKETKRHLMQWLNNRQQQAQSALAASYFAAYAQPVLTACLKIRVPPVYIDKECESVATGFEQWLADGAADEEEEKGRGGGWMDKVNTARHAIAAALAVETKSKDQRVRVEGIARSLQAECKRVEEQLNTFRAQADAKMDCTPFTTCFLYYAAFTHATEYGLECGKHAAVASAIDTPYTVTNEEDYPLYTQAQRAFDVVHQYHTQMEKATQVPLAAAKRERTTIYPQYRTMMKGCEELDYLTYHYKLLCMVVDTLTDRALVTQSTSLQHARALLEKEQKARTVTDSCIPLDRHCHAILQRNIKRMCSAAWNEHANFVRDTYRAPHQRMQSSLDHILTACRRIVSDESRMTHTLDTAWQDEECPRALLDHPVPLHWISRFQSYLSLADPSYPVPALPSVSRSAETHIPLRQFLDLLAPLACSLFIKASKV